MIIIIIIFLNVYTTKQYVQDKQTIFLISYYDAYNLPTIGSKRFLVHLKYEIEM